MSSSVIYKEFKILYWAKPIPDRSFDYEFVHVDYDGEHDGRCGNGKTIESCKAQIDEYWDHFYSAKNEEAAAKR